MEMALLFQSTAKEKELLLLSLSTVLFFHILFFTHIPSLTKECAQLYIPDDGNNRSLALQSKKALQCNISFFAIDV